MNASRRCLLLGALGTVCLFVGGCRAPASQAVGSGSFEIQGAPRTLATRQKEPTDTQVARNWTHYVAAHPRTELTQPDYPPAAREATAGACIVYLPVTFDENGMARDIHPSWNRVGPMNDLAEVFIAAATATIESWDIEPAREVHWTRDENGEEKYLRTEKVSESMEIRFSFDPINPPR